MNKIQITINTNMYTNNKAKAKIQNLTEQHMSLFIDFGHRPMQIYPEIFWHPQSPTHE